MAYKVINAFKDTKDKKREYSKNEKYPKSKFVPDQQRLNELKSKGFIIEVADEVKKPKAKPSENKLKAGE